MTACESSQPLVEAARMPHVATRVRIAAPRQSVGDDGLRIVALRLDLRRRLALRARRATAAGTSACAAVAPAVAIASATVSRCDSIVTFTSSPLDEICSSDFSASSRSWICTRDRPAPPLSIIAAVNSDTSRKPVQAALVAQPQRHRDAHRLPARGLGQQRHLHAVGQRQALRLGIDVGRRRVERGHRGR